MNMHKDMELWIYKGRERGKCHIWSNGNKIKSHENMFMSFTPQNKKERVEEEEKEKETLCFGQLGLVLHSY